MLWECDRVRAWALGAASLGYRVVQQAMQLALSELPLLHLFRYPYYLFSESDIKASGMA